MVSGIYTTGFSDYDTIAKRFRKSAILPYEFNGGVYALPETQTFQVMFYRSDILEELGLNPPKTWNELFVLLGRLQKKNMTIFMPPSVLTRTLRMKSMRKFWKNTEHYVN
mgnify:CR=1 FL=1